MGMPLFRSLCCSPSGWRPCGPTCRLWMSGSCMGTCATLPGSSSSRGEGGAPDIGSSPQHFRQPQMISGGGTVPVIGLCCHHRQVLLHFYINRRHQVPPAKKLFPMFCQFTAFHISKLHFLNYSMFMDGWYGERQTESFEMNCCSVTKS